MFPYFGKSKKASISESDPTWKVLYLGNVQSPLMKSEGCCDNLIDVIWRGFKAHPEKSISMVVSVFPGGLRVMTGERGIIKYSTYRLVFYTQDSNNKRLFAWVYRHETPRMKSELRCHIIMCASSKHAVDIENHLQRTVAFALRGFLREKNRRYDVRQILQKSKSEGISSLSRRSKLVTSNYRTPVENLNAAPRLMTIGEQAGEDENSDYGNESLNSGQSSMDSSFAMDNYFKDTSSESDSSSKIDYSMLGNGNDDFENVLIKSSSKKESFYDRMLHRLLSSTSAEERYVNFLKDLQKRDSQKCHAKENIALDNYNQSLVIKDDFEINEGITIAKLKEKVYADSMYKTERIFLPHKRIKESFYSDISEGSMDKFNPVLNYSPSFFNTDDEIFDITLIENADKVSYKNNNFFSDDPSRTVKQTTRYRTKL